jgi:hypothetical protein
MQRVACTADASVGAQVLWAALDAMPSLSEMELPPAVGLVLKLAAESGCHCTATVKMVRQRVAVSGRTVSTGTMDALRVAVQQHGSVAAAMLEDIEEDVREFSSPPASTET